MSRCREPQGAYGQHLQAVLDRAEREVQDRPLSHQRLGKTWTRIDLLESGDRLELEGYARKQVARELDRDKEYSNDEIMKLVAEKEEV